MATVEYGSAEQCSACVPAAVAIEEYCKTHDMGIDEENTIRILKEYAPLSGKHLQASHLPNLIDKILRSGAVTPYKQSNRSNDPIAHILNKAWPMRCSVRNFSEIVSAYILQYDTVYAFVMLLLHACMAGVYYGAVRANFRLQIVLYRYYVYQPIPREHLAQWVQNKNHSLLFVAIKEYMGYVVSVVPGLAGVLDDVFKWDNFARSVTHQGDVMRMTLNSHVGNPSTMFDAAFEACQTVKCFKCTTPLLDPYLVAEQIITAVRQCEIVQPTNVYMFPLRVPLYHLIRPLVEKGVRLHQLSTAFALPSNVVLALRAAETSSAASNTLRDIRRLQFSNLSQLLILHELICAYTLCSSIQLINLPSHITKQQKECKTTPVKHTIMLCVCCRQLREFVVDDNLQNGNAWARGHSKVIYDDCTGDLFCGRRPEKSTGRQKQKMSKDMVCVNTGPSASRSYWKAQQAHMCSYSPVLSFDVLGKALLCWGKIYVLCPTCMRIVQVRSSSFHGDTIRCIHCMYSGNDNQEISCFHCYTNSQSLSKIAFQTNIVHVCCKCERPWMKNDQITELLDITTAHRAINERWCTNQVMAHCACI